MMGGGDGKIRFAINCHRYALQRTLADRQPAEETNQDKAGKHDDENRHLGRDYENVPYHMVQGARGDTKERHADSMTD